MKDDRFDKKYEQIMKRYQRLESDQQQQISPLLKLVKSLFEYQRRSYKITHKLIDDYMSHLNVLIKNK